MNEITPSDIEAKLLEISKELNTIPGVMSLAKKASPSIAALAGIWLKKVGRILFYMYEQVFIGKERRDIRQNKQT